MEQEDEHHSYTQSCPVFGEGRIMPQSSAQWQSHLEGANARCHSVGILEWGGGQVGGLAELSETLKPGWDRMNGLGG